jgi:four helix bundle protein
MVKESAPKVDLPQRTFDFALEIIALCDVLEQTPGVSRTMSRQLQRSGTSIGANVEEAQAGQSRADFIAKSYIACKEARETHYWLRLLKASEIVPASRLTHLLDESNQLVAILTSITKKARANSNGKKPRP